MSDAPNDHELTDDEQRAEVAEQKLVRLAKRYRLIASGAEAYPVSVPVTTTIPALRAKYGSLVADLGKRHHGLDPAAIACLQ